jgi:hypothetical protein
MNWYIVMVEQPLFQIPRDEVVFVRLLLKDSKEVIILGQ